MSWLGIGDLTPGEDQKLKDLWRQYYALEKESPQAAAMLRAGPINTLVTKAMAPAPGQSWGEGAGARPSEYVQGGVDYGQVEIRPDGSSQFLTDYTAGPGGVTYGKVPLVTRQGPGGVIYGRNPTLIDKIGEAVSRYWKPVTAVAATVVVVKIASRR